MRSNLFAKDHREKNFIDILKVNIECSESDVLKSLTPAILDNIGVICAEAFNFPSEMRVFRKRSMARI